MWWGRFWSMYFYLQQEKMCGSLCCCDTSIRELWWIMHVQIWRKTHFSMSYCLCMIEVEQSEGETEVRVFSGADEGAELMVKGWRDFWFLGGQVRLVGYSLCMHSPSVQFLDWSTVPSQSFPPFLGAGAPHSRLLQWVHSVPQVDHLLHSVHRPSTAPQQTGQSRVEWWDGEWDDDDKQVQGGDTDTAKYANTDSNHISCMWFCDPASSPHTLWAGVWIPWGVPGQRGLHASFWMLCPSQMEPPLSGAGLVQLRVRFWKPRPQRLLHTDHSVQVDQPPFTGRKKESVSKRPH